MEKKTFHILLFIYIFTVLNSIFSAFAFANTSKNTTENQTVKVGYFILNDFQEIDYNKAYTGYGYDYLKLVEQYTGWTFEFVEASFSDCLELLENNEIDILGGLVQTQGSSSKILHTALPYSEKQYQLFTKVNNNKLFFESYEYFNNIRIGSIKGNQQIHLLEELSLEHNFNYTLVEYNTLFELESALKYGKIDAIFSSTITQMNNYKTIAKFARLPVFLGVSSSRPDLLEGLDKAMQDIRNINPHFSQLLRYKYKEHEYYPIPAFSKPEDDFRKTSPEIYVVALNDWKPMMYFDKGDKRYHGILVDILEYVSRLTGLTFRYTTIEEAEQIYKNNPDTNFIGVVNSDFSYANKNDFNISNTILCSPLVLISDSTISTKQNLTLAVPKGLITLRLIERDKDKYNYKILYLDSVEECLKAVKKGLVDATCLIDSAATYYLGTFEYDNFYTTNYNSEHEMISFGVPKNSDPHLLPMINKSLTCLSDKQLNNIIIKNTLIDYQFSIKALFYTYPKETILGVVCISLVTIFGLVASIYHYKRTKEELKNALLETTLSNERFKVALHQLPCDIIEYDFKTNRLFTLNKLDGTRTIVPFEVNALNSVPLCGAEYPYIKTIFDDLLARVKAGETTIEETLKGIHNGKDCWGRFTLTAVFSGTKPIQMIGTIADVTAEVCADQDSLTQLYNRRAFSELVCQEIKQAFSSEQTIKPYGVFMMIDLDDFKGINDTYGHLSGDLCLIHIAQILQQNLCEYGLVARMGGDEFAVFTPNMQSIELAKTKSIEIFESIHNSSFTTTDGATVSVGISMGVCIFPEDAKDFLGLYENADKALYKAKHRNKNQISFYQ